MIDKDLLRRMRRIEIRTGHLVDEVFSGRYASAFRGRGMEFEEVRPYQVGDDVRTIDWNVSARTGAPHVKIFREERELSVVLMADMSGSLAFGTRARLKRELVAELGAIIAFSAMRNNDRVGLVMATDRVEHVVPPRKGSAHAMRLVRDLLARPVEGSGTDLAGALDHLSRMLRRRSVVMLMSDFRDDGWLRSLRMLRRRHDVIAAHIVDPAETRLPKAGLLLMRDPESGVTVTVDSGSQRVRMAFAQRAASRQAAIERDFRRAGVDTLSIATDESPADALIRFFRMREARR